MEYQELKLLMRSKARLARGFVNLLRDDAELIYGDVVKFDLGHLSEDIRELKQTATQLMDAVGDLEYCMHLAIRSTNNDRDA